MLPARDGVREVEPQLKEYLDRLERRIAIRCAAVFGSRARGDHWVDSDIDLVVVSEAFQGLRRGQRIDILLEDWGGIPALEPFGYTTGELLEADHPFLLEMLSDGRPVKDDGIWPQAQARLAEVLEGGDWKRIPGGWREGPRRMLRG